jgi:glutamine cyclotransferase
MKLGEKFIIILVIVLMSTYIAFYILNDPKTPNAVLNSTIHLGSSNNTTSYSYQIVNTFPHDQDAFTQGLVYEDGFLYEGTGLWGESELRKVDIQTGNVLNDHKLSDKYFGEGITIFGDRIIQLTWKSNIGFVYDQESFELLETFDYPTEGWGITHDGTHLIMSDGSDKIYFLDPETFEVERTIKVTFDEQPIDELNELEFIYGDIFANVWKTDKIARIDPETGNVTGWIFLDGLLSSDQKTGSEDVLNGIAFDSKNDRIFVTGKKWPKLFEIELVLMRN